jgi:two-component system osmolarity sensor histidine kinase EnvZ
MAATPAKPLIRARNHPAQLVKRILPRGLFGRSLLIILVPLLVLEGVALRIFYGSHLDVVSRRLSGAIVEEISFTINMIRRFPGATNEASILRSAQQSFLLDMHLDRDAVLPPSERINVLGPSDDDLAHALTERFRAPFAMDWTSDPRHVIIRLQLPEGVLHVVAPRKRLSPGTIFLFIGWIAGSAAILFLIAALFMRIQVRALRRLAAAAEDFGMGRDGPPIRPEGATEVRQAGVAFNRMQERVRRFLAQRTEMLAGVSHDLRTPLTRLKLTLAMLPDNDSLRHDVSDMTADVVEMERMIEGYLAFARGERAEQAEPTDLIVLLGDIVTQTNRSGAAVDLRAPETLVLRLRADAIRRAVGNLVDNACRHAKTVRVSVEQTERAVIVAVDDNGPGIPADRRENVFRPFESGSHGGTGLGLTIARDIARAHGGDITLSDSPLGGLSARLRLPR